MEGTAAGGSGTVRALVDLRCLETASAVRGVGRYTRELISELLPILPRGWSLAGLSWSSIGASLGVGDVRYPGPRRGIGIADRWLLPPLFRREGITLYHSPAYALPARGAAGTALVLTIHDLVAEVFPAALSWRHRAAFRRTFRSAAAAHRVLTVSRRTRDDLLSRYPLDPARVVTVPNGVAAAFAAARETSGTSPGADRSYLLYVGGLDPLKNVPFLLQVLARCRAEGLDLRLVVAGEEGPRRRALERSATDAGLGGFVTGRGRLDDEALAASYRGALAFVFPSRYEGFGLPPLEAMACGCPVVSSPAGALAEVLGEAALLVDPGDAGAWASAVARIAREPGLRERLTAAGRARAAAFTWAETARRTLDAYQAAVEEARPA